MAESGRRLDASALRDWAHTAVGDLIAHTDEINRLNVFPVADADTGTNMLFTMRAAWAQADADARGGDVAAVAAALADGALQGARGNSGVILSQILRGLADVAAEAAAERGGELTEVDGAVLAAALRHAVGLVVASMGESVPGTIVSVSAGRRRSGRGRRAEDADLGGVVAAAAEAAVVALDKTIEQLDVLADAGVVDAGGRGPAGAARRAVQDRVRSCAGPRVVCAVAARPSSATVAAPAPPRFEVMYLLSGCDPDGVEQPRQRLDELGDSVAIAASSSVGGGRYSVHVHSDDAGGAIEAALPFGTPSRIQITALTGGAGARARRLDPRARRAGCRRR